MFRLNYRIMPHSSKSVYILVILFVAIGYLVRTKCSWYASENRVDEAMTRRDEDCC